MARKVILLLKDNGDGTHLCTDAIVVGADMVLTQSGVNAGAGPGWTLDANEEWQAPAVVQVDGGDDVN
jgi:hypothetical protein